MSTSDLGRLIHVDLRSYWQREDTHFTPWLSQEDNISLLGDTIDMDLEVIEQEASVGPFRADILCRNAADNTMVLIENQLERTDHGHLGQLLTYAAGLDAVTLVWIVERFAEEHRATLDWLNHITDEEFHFFGLEIELWQIGSSIPAPKFNIVVKPNDWSKTVKEVSQGRKPVTPGQQAQVDYWTSFGEFVRAHSTSVRPPKPYPSNWMGYGVGRSGVTLILVFNQDVVAVNIETNNRDHPGWFHLLHEQRESIEDQLGFELHWNERADLKFSCIAIRMHVDGQDRKEWPRIHAWMLDRAENFRRVFPPIVKALDDSSWSPPDDGETSP